MAETVIVIAVSDLYPQVAVIKAEEISLSIVLHREEQMAEAVVISAVIDVCPYY